MHALGKLYERIILAAFRCRALTMDTSREVTVAEFIEASQRTDGPLWQAPLSAFDRLPAPAVCAFPRAANTACSAMPTVVPFATQLTHASNASFDSLLCLPVKAGPSLKAVVIGVQNKEWCSLAPYDAESERKKRVRNMTWTGDATGARVKRFLNDKGLIHLLATPNTKMLPLATWKAHGKVHHEAVVTHDDIRKWSPMVAYSGCDARVLIVGPSDSEEDE
jgi:hypothetical protein